MVEAAANHSIILLPICQFRHFALHFTTCSFLRAQKLLAPRPPFKLIVFLGADWRSDYHYYLLNGYDAV